MSIEISSRKITLIPFEKDNTIYCKFAIVKKPF